MATESDRIHFGSVLDRETSDKKVWLLVVPALALLIGGAVWAFSAVSRADSYRAEVERQKTQLAELQKSLDERDKLLVDARKDEGILKSPGQAVGIFYGMGGDATESGIAVAMPSEKAARVILYGLVAPPEGQEYVLAARGADGQAKPLMPIQPTETGSALVLAKDVPEGTNAIELLLRPAGQEALDQATPRIAARFPASDQDRGVLVQPVAQARRGRR